jgi:hypothetical protein
MLGLALYNSSLIRKKVNYLVMPLYSTGQRSLRGSAQAGLSLHPPKGPRGVTLAFQAQRYERYRKLAPTLTFDFTKRVSGAWQQQLQAGYTAIAEENKIFSEGSYTSTGQTFRYGVPWLRYQVQRQDALQGFAAEGKADLLPNRSFSGKLTLRYHRYYSAKEKFRARLFAGRLFSNDAGNPTWYALGLSGSPDYKKESVFLDRSQISDGLAAFRRQTDGQDGGFRNYIPVYSTDWLTTLNLDADLPLVPAGAYLDLGLSHGLYYGTGFSVSLVKENIQIYLPLAGSNYAQDIPHNFTEFKNNIRFLVSLPALSPFRLVNDLLR